MLASTGRRLLVLQRHSQARSISRLRPTVTVKELKRVSWSSNLECVRQLSNSQVPKREHDAPKGVDQPDPPRAIPNEPAASSHVPFGSSPVRDAILTSVVGLALVFVGGIAYVQWYKANVLHKIERAFAPGYDPALELAKRDVKPKDTALFDEDFQVEQEHLRRKEQDWVDSIIQGREVGSYFMLLGPKGTGKGTMMFDAMKAIEADGVAICDAHPDLEVFRLRLGKAIDYEFNEDTQTGLFQRRDPREAGPSLDIERAMNKLEKVALRLARRKGRPLVLIINNVHFFKNDDEGKNMLLQLQQRAESWAAAGILTLVFSSDDFWPYTVIRKTASRMHVLSISDLSNAEALRASMKMHLGARKELGDPATLKEAVGIVGGRLSYLNKVSCAKDPVGYAKSMLEIEKAWLLSQIGLIPDHDDDVMDEQKWSSCSWLLLQEFVKIRQAQEQERDERRVLSGITVEEEEPLEVPSIPYWRCRQIMTRPDFLEDLDRANIIAIDINHAVRPDSMLILHAATEVCSEPGFDEVLDNVRARVDEIESLHRTRELTFKDLSDGDRVVLRVSKAGEGTILERPS